MGEGVPELDVLLAVGGGDLGVEAILLEGYSNLSAVLVKLVDAEIFLEGGDHLIVNHVLPAPVELHIPKSTSIS